MIKSIYEKMLEMYANKLEKLTFNNYNKDLKKLQKYMSKIKILSEKIN